MDPLGLVPEAAAIPLHPLAFQVLLVLTFALHLLLMNVVVGGGVVALVAEFQARKNEKMRGLGKELAPKMTMTLALAVNLGVAPLLFLQVLYGQYLYTSSVLMAWPWLGLLGVLIVAYYGLYLYNFRYDRLKGSRLLVVGFCVLLLLAVAFVFSNNMTLMLRPERWVRYFDAPGGWLLNLGEPTLAPRYLHMVVSALAVGGLFVAVMADFQHKRGKMPLETAERRKEYGMRWFTRTTLLQLILGPLFLITLPRDIMWVFLGGKVAHTGLLLAVLALVALVLYLGIRRKLWPTVWALVALVLAMSTLRALVRIEYLAPEFSVNHLAVAPQYGAFALFIVSLLLGLAAIGWMLKQALAAGRNAETRTPEEG